MRLLLLLGLMTAVPPVRAVPSDCPKKVPKPLHIDASDPEGRPIRKYQVDPDDLKVRFDELTEADRGRFLNQDYRAGSAPLLRMAGLWRCAEPDQRKRFCSRLEEGCRLAAEHSRKTACSYLHRKACP